jgi:hypothetical protein
MSGSGIDEDVAIAIVVGVAALACLVFAVRRFSSGSVSVGVVWSICAAALGFVAWFFATFTMRLF